MFILAFVCMVNVCLSQDTQSHTLSVITYAESGKILEIINMDNDEASVFDVLDFYNSSEADRIVVRGYYYEQELLHTINFDTDLMTTEEEICQFENSIVEPHLGVGVESAEVYPGIIINKVSEKSAADLAGLLEGTIIISYNGIELGSFCDLINAVKGSEIGETIELVIQDGDELKTIYVTLGERGKIEVSFDACEGEAGPQFALDQNDIISDVFNVYPNPTDGKINIELQTQQLSSVFYILDGNGKIVHQRKVENLSNGTLLEYTFENESPGYYYIVLENDKGIEKEKIIYTKN